MIVTPLQYSHLWLRPDEDVADGLSDDRILINGSGAMRGPGV